MDGTNLILSEACAVADDIYISESLSYYDSLPEFKYSKDFLLALLSEEKGI